MPALEATTKLLEDIAELRRLYNQAPGSVTEPADNEHEIKPGPGVLTSIWQKLKKFRKDHKFAINATTFLVTCYGCWHFFAPFFKASYLASHVGAAALFVNIHAVTYVALTVLACYITMSTLYWAARCIGCVAVAIRNMAKPSLELVWNKCNGAARARAAQAAKLEQLKLEQFKKVCDQIDHVSRDITTDNARQYEQDDYTQIQNALNSNQVMAQDIKQETKRRKHAFLASGKIDQAVHTRYAISHKQQPNKQMLDRGTMYRNSMLLAYYDQQFAKQQLRKLQAPNECTIQLVAHKKILEQLKATEQTHAIIRKANYYRKPKPAPCKR